MKKIAITLIVAASFAWAGPGNAQTFTENFTTDPGSNGWQVFGNSNQFQWDSTNHDMAVTWDSSQPNSYFYHALPMTLTKETGFMLAFDLNLSDAAVGTDPDAPYTFELAIGLLNLTNAMDPDFLRGSGFSPNVVEFDYFPDDGLGDTATTGPTVISAGDNFDFSGDTYPMALTMGHSYHIQMTYVASNQTLVTLMLDNGQPFGPIQEAILTSVTNFDDFQLDQLAIINYSGAGQDPMYAGSLLAHGTVSNFIFSTPPPVGFLAGAFANGIWQVQCASLTNWLYTLERTADFKTFTPASATVPGNGGTLILQDTNAPPGMSFYSVFTKLP